MSESIAPGLAEAVTDSSARGYRAANRRPCNTDFLIRLVVRPSFQNQRAFVQDISTSGVGLLVSRPLKKGAMLAMQFHPGSRTCPIVTAKVARSTRHGEEWWLVGCEFPRVLDEAELDALLEDE